eukprot:4108618-Karenia_brevis.AAC.2
MEDEHTYDKHGFCLRLYVWAAAPKKESRAVVLDCMSGLRPHKKRAGLLWAAISQKKRGFCPRT